LIEVDKHKNNGFHQILFIKNSKTKVSKTLPFAERKTNFSFKLQEGSIAKN
jgi:hypothetical protein